VETILGTISLSQLPSLQRQSSNRRFPVKKDHASGRKGVFSRQIHISRQLLDGKIIAFRSEMSRRFQSLHKILMARAASSWLAPDLSDSILGACIFDGHS
jgi:hypothetical protein